MSLNLELKKIKFIMDSGINFFLQNSINSRYQIKKEIDTNNNKIIDKNIKDLSTLSELEIYIKNSDVCALKKNAKKTVFSDGNPKSRVMIIGEAPGAEEDNQGLPFVGLAGKLLDKMLNSINLDRKSVYITNVIPWRPPNNREPSTEEIIQCMPFIQKHIELIKPNLIILLGGTASKAILATNIGITKLRGSWHEYKNLDIDDPIKVRAIYHPAYLLRNPIKKKDAWTDLQEIQKLLIK